MLALWNGCVVVGSQYAMLSTSTRYSEHGTRMFNALCVMRRDAC